MRVYLAGTMSSRVPDRNVSAFDRWSKRLRECGHEVIDPREVGGYGGDWHAAMRRDVAALSTCDAVAVIPGVADTDRGVWMEVTLAFNLGLPVTGADSPWFSNAPRVSGSAGGEGSSNNAREG